MKQLRWLLADIHLVKAHGAGDDSQVGTEPEGASLEQMGLGWTSSHGVVKVLMQLEVV